MSLPSWNDIPEREPLASAGGGWGPGIADDLTPIHPRDLIGEKFAVVGFVFLPSQYDEDQKNPLYDQNEKPKPKEYAKVHILFPDNKEMVFNTSSNSLMQTLKARHENDEIPFRTKLETKRSKRGYNYYVFE